MQDRPTAIELLTAVREFLEQDVLPGLDGRKRFHTLVAEWRRLCDLLAVDETNPPARLDGLRAAVRELTRRLCDRIRAGEADAGAFGDAVRAHVRMTVVEKLRVANPRYVEPAPG